MGHSDLILLVNVDICISAQYVSLCDYVSGGRPNQRKLPKLPFEKIGHCQLICYVHTLGAYLHQISSLYIQPVRRTRNNS